MKFLITFISILIIFSANTFSTPLSSINNNRALKPDTTIIYMSDFGLKKMRDKDCVKKVNNALETVKGSNPKKLVFQRGEYHFYPEHAERRYYSESNTTDENPRKCALLLKMFKILLLREMVVPLFFMNRCNRLLLIVVKI